MKQARMKNRRTHTGTHLKLVRTLTSRAEASPCTGCICSTGPSTREMRVAGMGRCNACTASWTSWALASPFWSKGEQTCDH
eukprot:1158881-Pelagomonas_calceolata.AAC.8